MEKCICARCNRESKDDEYFKLWLKYPYWLKDLCPKCHDELTKIESDAKRKMYASGEENPEYESEIICPYCGSEYSDSWEFQEDEDEIQCDDCGKEFTYSRDIEVTYSTYRKEE